MAMLPGSESSISQGVKDTLHLGREDLGDKLKAASSRSQEGGRGCTHCGWAVPWSRTLCSTLLPALWF